jgi:hypothetical protein
MLGAESPRTIQILWVQEAAAQPAADTTPAGQQQQQQQAVSEPFRLRLAEGPEGRAASVRDAASPPDLAAAEPPLYFLAGGSRSLGCLAFQLEKLEWPSWPRLLLRALGSGVLGLWPGLFVDDLCLLITWRD